MSIHYRIKIPLVKKSKNFIDGSNAKKLSTVILVGYSVKKQKA